MVQPMTMMVPDATLRQTVFLSKATPGDDAFALWLAPRLEARGYKVFADIMSLDAGDRWRKKITSALQNDAIKMLLCCSDESLTRNGVDEEISMADDLAKELSDPNFMIPLRLRPFRKTFGTAGLQWVDFTAGWAEGLTALLTSLERQGVPHGNPERQISSEWERYQKRLQVTLEHVPEPLTSNWVRVTSAPDQIHFFSPQGSIDHTTIENEGKTFRYPLVKFNRGFFGLCGVDEVSNHFATISRYEVSQSIQIAEFLLHGVPDLGIDDRTAKNIFTQIMRMAWEKYCVQLGLLAYEFSSGPSFHVSDNQARIGQRIPWGRQGARRSSMLRNISKKKVWEFGMSATPNLFPFPHFRLKSRVLFAEIAGEASRGLTITDTKVQHRYRRTVCSPWRNPAWHGRLMAYLELLAPEAAEIKLPVGNGLFLCVEATPIVVTSPVSTLQTRNLGSDAEEPDDTTLPPGLSDEEED